MKIAGLAVSLWLCFVLGKAAAQPVSGFDPVPFVNPFIGTDAHGHTFPGASLPFGMVQLSPDTRLEGWDGCSGYHFSDHRIYGFSHTHLSGTGVPDYCDVLLTPFTGPVQTTPDGYASPFRKQNERAEAGYYRVLLDKNDVLAELTATPRTGVHRYSFPSTEPVAKLLIDLAHRDKVTGSAITVVDSTLVVGYRFTTDWARDQRVYFAMRFSRPFRAFETHRAPDQPAVASLQFANDSPLVVVVAISGVDIEGALKNLRAEAPHNDFDLYRKQAHDTWQKSLSRIEVAGGSEQQKRVFYTALYHTLLAPNLFSDVDGRYRGHDGQVHNATGHNVYTVFSLWDTYRACKPLYSLLEPDRMNDFIQTFLRQYEQSGLLPVWELAGNETNCMIGYHSVPVIADAWRKGIRGYDGARALQAMTASATQEVWGQPAYRKWGCIPADVEGESVSKTLEYAYDDWCIAQMARMLEKTDVYNAFIARSQYWKNLFNPNTGFFQAKVNAAWYAPFDPYEVNFNYTEANAWQYRFAVPHDIGSLMQHMGGPAAFAGELDKLFTAKPQTTGREQADITGLIGQYAHGNEPSHHVAYLYNFAGQPWKTQRYVRQIMDDLYTDRPDGLCGNEDVGQMSAWLVFSALGFYPVTPASNTYVVGTPWFEKVTWRLDNGHTVTIEAPGVSKNRFYVDQLQVNGSNRAESFLTHEMLARGAQLRFSLSGKPGAWATDPAHCPVQVVTDQPIVPAPFVAEGSRVFRGKQSIRLACADPDARIRYTLDGSDPRLPGSLLFSGPFDVSTDTHLRMIAVRDGQAGFEAEARFSPIRENWKVHRYNTAYTSPYTGGGPDGLIDQLRGSIDFRSGGWQGFQGVNLDVVIDLGASRPLNRVSVGFLQDENSWIFFPESLTVMYAGEDEQFKTLGQINNTVPADRSGAQVQALSVPAQGQQARYLRVLGRTLGVCPPWHKGAGHPCWVFADEITVE